MNEIMNDSHDKIDALEMMNEWVELFVKKKKGGTIAVEECWNQCYNNVMIETDYQRRQKWMV